MKYNNNNVYPHYLLCFRYCVFGDISHNSDCRHTVGQEDQDIHTDHQGGSKVSEQELLCSTSSSSPLRAVAYIPGVMFYPLVTWLLIILVVGYWGVAAVYPTNSPPLSLSLSCVYRVCAP